MYTCSRDSPISPSSVSSSLPAWPTNGYPCLSSWKPGASPTNIRSACGSPTPKTTCVRPCASRQRVQPATWRSNASSSVSCCVRALSGVAGGAGPEGTVLRRTGPESPVPPAASGAGRAGLCLASADAGESVRSAAATRTAAATATRRSEAGLLGGAVRREDRELLAHVRGGAVRAVRLLAVPDELLEVRLALHADVFVDRHRERP